jgi:Tfp pilus assembly protein PilN
MRELEFLPGWYPKLVRRRRWLMFQGWGAIGLIIVLMVRSAAGYHALSAAQASLDGLQQKLSQTNDDLLRLGEQRALRSQLERQNEVVARLGPHVPAARLMAALGEAMPPEMALLDLTLNQAEKPRAASALAAARGDAHAAVDRRLSVTLTGVAPSDMELATFIDRLEALPCVQDVAMAYAKDSVHSGRAMREFSINFWIDLSGDN